MAKGRSKLGGNKPLTKNQRMKAERKQLQDQRLKRVISEGEDFQINQQKALGKETKAKKIRKPTMFTSSINRRIGAKTKLEIDLKASHSPETIYRMKKELQTLLKRI